MATHSSILAWRIPGTGELGGLPSMGSYRVGHDWRDLAAYIIYILFQSVWHIIIFVLPVFIFVFCSIILILHFSIYQLLMGSSGDSEKNLPAMQETQVQSLGREEPLEKGIATHSSILASRISWTDEPGGLQSMGFQKVRHDWATNTFTFFQLLLVLSLPFLTLEDEGALHLPCSTLWDKHWLYTFVL